MVVQDDNLERPGCGVGEQLGRVLYLRCADSAGLVPPRPHRVQTHDVELLGAVERLGRLPATLKLLEGAGEAGERGVGDVVVPRDRQNGRAEPLKEVSGAVMLVGPAAVSQVAAGHDQLGIEPVDQACEARFKMLLSVAADVKIGEV